MNKKFISIAVLGFLVFSGTVKAQIQNNLPNPGIKPDSFFYFLDRFGESIQEFFTFNPEAKARLQIKFAGERIAEINYVVEKKGPEAKGINKAKTLLLDNVAQAAEIVKEEKTNGKDVTKLAKEIDEEFDAQEKLLIESFQEARKKLKKERLELKKSLVEKSGDDSLLSEIEQQLNDLENEDSMLKNTKENIKESLRNERKKIEDELDDIEKELDQQEEMEKDKKEDIEDMEIEDDNEDDEMEKKKESIEEDEGKNDEEEIEKDKKEKVERKKEENQHDEEGDNEDEED